MKTKMVGEGSGGVGGGGPDWVVIGGGIATMLTVLGGIIAGMRGSNKARSTDDYHRRQARETAATANASLTLESVFRLVNEYQEEVARKSADISRIEGACQEARTVLLVRIGDLEAEIRALKVEQHALDQKIRDLRNKLQKEL